MRENPAESSNDAIGGENGEGEEGSEESSAGGRATAAGLRRIAEMMNRSSMLTAEGQNAQSGAPKHRFWSTQPVPQPDQIAERITEEEFGAISAVNSVDEIRRTPYPLLSKFEWCECDVLNEKEIDEIYKFLNTNYVEDDDAMFRFDYSREFLKWALKPPGVNLEGIFQAVYTAGVVLTQPVVQCRYYHRSLNPKKLIKVGFSRLAPRMTMLRTIKLYSLSDTTQTPGLRVMTKEDLPTVLALLKAYHKKHLLRIEFSLEDLEHWMLPIDKVMYSYVVEDPGTKKVTDFASFYFLPSTVIRDENDTNVNAAYLFYYAAAKTPLTDLLRDLLILARDVGCDVFNALDAMDNLALFSDLNFHIGDGQLNYYLYNWKCRSIEPSETALILL